MNAFGDPAGASPRARETFRKVSLDSSKTFNGFHPAVGQMAYGNI